MQLAALPRTNHTIGKWWWQFREPLHSHVHFCGYCCTGGADGGLRVRTTAFSLGTCFTQVPEILGMFYVILRFTDSAIATYDCHNVCVLFCDFIFSNLRAHYYFRLKDELCKSEASVTVFRLGVVPECPNACPSTL